MPSHTVVERAKNTHPAPVPTPSRSPADLESSRLFGALISPPSSFKDNVPTTLPVPELESPIDRPQFKRQ